MGSIFCSKCGVESPEDEGFCSKCGTALFKPKATVPPAEPPATDSPEVTPKKKVTFQVVPALIVFGVVIVFTFGWALVDADFNRGVKETVGVDIAGTLENIPGVGTSANVFKFSSDCASQLCNVTITDARGKEESFKSIAPRTWGFTGIGSQDYFISVQDSEGKSATCTIYGDGTLIKSESSVSSDATCQVKR